MWNSSGDLCSPEWPRTSSLDPNERRQRKDYNSKLQELALLLPVALKTGTKKLTKKEILLHVLHYIQYLQRNIDVAKALLKLYISENEDAQLSENPTVDTARQRHCTPPSSPCSRKSQLKRTCQKPQKRKQTQTSERQTRAQNPRRRCLTLPKPEKSTLSPDQKGGNPAYCYGASTQDDEPSPDLGVQQGAERIYFLNRTQPFPRQKLVVYESSEEANNEYPDGDPWLPAWTPENSPPGSPLALEPLQVENLGTTGHPSEILRLSPSLFSSPGTLMPEQILEEDIDYLTQALFGEVYLGPESPPSACKSEASESKDTPIEDPGDPTNSHSLFQSSISLDHCYLSLNETSKAPSSPGYGTTETESLCEEQQEQDVPSSSDEDGDYTWTPTRRASTLPPGGRKFRKGRAARGPAKSKKSEIAVCPPHMKKKCINGFIMFCRMNRKQYIRACPGTASTTATKELAQLWRLMTEKERKPYCIKARRFSRQHNRIVKQENSSSEDEDWEPPKPFYQLLADKAPLGQ